MKVETSEILIPNFKEYFYIDENWELRWKINRKANKVKDSIAGSINSLGYKKVVLNGRGYLVHRIIWDLTYPNNKVTKQDIIDHIDGNPSNNNVINLRKTNQRGNMQNKKKHRSGKLIGACFSKRLKKWESTIYINGKQYYLGIFNTEQESNNMYMYILNKYNTTGELPIEYSTKKGLPRYISIDSTSNKYRIFKRINGKPTAFGSFNTLGEAINKLTQLTEEGIL